MLWCVKTLSFKAPMYVGSMLWRVRTLSFQSFPVCGPCAMAYGDFEIFHKAPMCVVPVLWCVSTWSFQSSTSCVGSVLWRVRTLSFQSSHLCELCAVVCEDSESSKFPCALGFVLWRVRTLSFQSSPRCGLCVVVCEDFEFLKFTCMWALCCGTSRLCPSIGEIDFPKKVLIGISPLYWRDCFLGSKSL